MPPQPSVFRTTQARSSKRRLDGLYKQVGENDFVMLRVRAPAGQWRTDQWRVVAQIAQELGDGQLHFTTRQEPELHGVSFAKVDEVLQRLREADLTTRGACGDCVRNVTACPGAGICPNEIGDAGQLARDISRELAESQRFEDLPRKFKVSVSGCGQACALPQIQDVGLVARCAGQEEVAFDVFLAGGLGRRPMLAQKVFHSWRLDDVIPFVRAAVECFHDLGDRQRRHRARLKFVAEALGHEQLYAQIQERLAKPAWYPQI